MKTSVISMIGIILIVAGIGMLAYKGIHFTTQEKIAQIGDIQVTTEDQKRINFSPMAGGLAIVLGVILVALGRRKD